MRAPCRGREGGPASGTLLPSRPFSLPPASSVTRQNYLLDSRAGPGPGSAIPSAFHSLLRLAGQKKRKIIYLNLGALFMYKNPLTVATSWRQELVPG